MRKTQPVIGRCRGCVLGTLLVWSVGVATVAGALVLALAEQPAPNPGTPAEIAARTAPIGRLTLDAGARDQAPAVAAQTAEEPAEAPPGNGLQAEARLSEALAGPSATEPPGSGVDSAPPSPAGAQPLPRAEAATTAAGVVMDTEAMASVAALTATDAPDTWGTPAALMPPTAPWHAPYRMVPVYRPDLPGGPYRLVPVAPPVR